MTTIIYKNVIFQNFYNDVDYFYKEKSPSKKKNKFLRSIHLREENGKF